MSFSDHNVTFGLATTGRTSSAHPNPSNVRPERTLITGKHLQIMAESRAVKRTEEQMAKCVSPSFHERMRRFEETLEANLAIFCGGQS